MNLRDDYARQLDELLNDYRDELEPGDLMETHAVETACLIDPAIDEIAENMAKLETDFRGLRR